jgi:uncharacterized protein (TIGR00369 family)
MSESHVPNLAELGRRMIAGEAPGAPVARLIGFVPKRIENGEAFFEMEVEARHANPMGTLHGGILCDLVDAAMGMAFASTLAEGESFTTLELKINFLKAVWKAKLTAKARVVKRGKTVGLVEADVTNEAGDLVARASSTCMVLRGKAAEGR